MNNKETEFGYFIIFQLLTSDARQHIENLDDLRKLISMGLKECKNVTEIHPSSLEDYHSYYRKAMSITYKYSSLEELERNLKPKMGELGLLN